MGEVSPSPGRSSPPEARCQPHAGRPPSPRPPSRAWGHYIRHGDRGNSSWRPRTFGMGTEALGEAARAVQGPPGGLSLCQRPGTRWPLAEGSHLLASGRGQQLAGSEARDLLSRVVLPSELSATGLGGIPKKKKPAEKKKKKKKTGKKKKKKKKKKKS